MRPEYGAMLEPVRKLKTMLLRIQDFDAASVARDLEIYINKMSQQSTPAPTEFDLKLAELSDKIKNKPKEK